MTYFRVLFAFLIFLTSVSLHAQSNSISFIEKVQVDGKSTEWSNSYRLISFTQSNLSNSNQIKIYGGWNELNLFLLFDVRDSKLITLTNDSNKVHLNDAVEFFIDPLCDSKTKMDINDHQFLVGVNGKHTILKGDYRKTDSDTIEAPKEHGLSTLIFKYKVSALGTINSMDVDSGYLVEMSIPFSAIGIEQKEGVHFKADFCVDDADSLVDIFAIPDSGEVPAFYFSSYNGYSNFSFPSDWSVFTLKGKPSGISTFIKSNGRSLLWLVIIVVIASVLVIFWLSYRIRQLKNVPEKSSIVQFEQIQHYIDESSLLKEKPSEQTIESEEPEVIKKARDYISKNIQNEIEMEKLASDCAVSVRQLQRIFKEHLGITPSGFVAILKMEEAQNLLKSGKYNVTEVAYHLGYSDAAYFTRVFKKYFGHPPSQILG